MASAPASGQAEEEHLQEQEVRELLERLREAMDPDLDYRYRHEDYLVPEWRAGWSKPVIEEPVAG